MQRDRIGDISRANLAIGYEVDKATLPIEAHKKLPWHSRRGQSHVILPHYFKIGIKNRPTFWGARAPDDKLVLMTLELEQ